MASRMVDSGNGDVALSLEKNLKSLQNFLSRHKSGLATFDDKDLRALAAKGFVNRESIKAAGETALLMCGLSRAQCMFLEGCAKEGEPPKKKSIGWENVRGRVENVLAHHKLILEACVEDKLLDELPPFSVSLSHPSAQKFNAAGMRSFDGLPSFLLHELPKCEADRSRSTLDLPKALARAFDAFSLGAVQGAGKTRLMFEHACLHFSFYFIAGAAVNNPGSADLQDCLRFLSELIGPDREANHRAAEKQLKALLVARLLILDRLLDMAKEADRVLSPRSFLLLQLALGGQDKDVCLDMYRAVQLLSVTELQGQLEKLAAKVQQVTGESNLPIFADEAHILAMRLHEFPSRSKPEKPRAILNEVYLILGADIRKLGFRLVLSGSGLEMEDLEATLTGIEKMDNSNAVLQLRISDGFYEKTDHRRYILRFTSLPPPACNLIFRLLQGRFRHTVGFLRRYLMDPRGDWTEVLESMQSLDPQSAVSLLQEQLLRLTDRVGPGNPSPRASRIKQNGQEASVVELVKYCVFNRLVGRRSFTWAWPVEREALRVGFAPFKEVTDLETGGSVAVISEPLSILAVLRTWFEGSASRLCREVATIAMRLTHEQSARGFGVEIVVPSLLESIFDGKTDVRAHPLFQDVRHLPDWFRGPAELVTVYVDPQTKKLVRCMPAIDGFIGRGLEKDGENPKLVDWLLNSWGHIFFCPEQKAVPDAVTVVLFLHTEKFKLLTVQVKYVEEDFATAKTEGAFQSLSSARFGVGAEDLLDGPYKRAEGIIQMLILYPGACGGESTGVVGEDVWERGTSTRTGKKQKLVSKEGDLRIVVDRDNASDFFDEDLLRLLASLKLERPQPLAEPQYLPTPYDAEECA